MDEKGTRLWKCAVCGRTNKDKDKADIRRHMEKLFHGFEHLCPHCDKQCNKSRKALKEHISNYHKHFV